MNFFQSGQLLGDHQWSRVARIDGAPTAPASATAAGGCASTRARHGAAWSSSSAPSCPTRRSSLYALLYEATSGRRVFTNGWLMDEGGVDRPRRRRGARPRLRRRPCCAAAAATLDFASGARREVSPSNVTPNRLFLSARSATRPTPPGKRPGRGHHDLSDPEAVERLVRPDRQRLPVHRGRRRGLRVRRDGARQPREVPARLSPRARSGSLRPRAGGTVPWRRVAGRVPAGRPTLGAGAPAAAVPGVGRPGGGSSAIGGGSGGRALDVGCGAHGLAPDPRGVGRALRPGRGRGHRRGPARRRPLVPGGGGDLQCRARRQRSLRQRAGAEIVDLVHARYLIAPLGRGPEQVARAGGLVRPGSNGPGGVGPRLVALQSPRPAAERLIRLLSEIFARLGGEAGRGIPGCSAGSVSRSPGSTRT